MIWALILSMNVYAVEPTNPTTLCDRFISPETQKACVSRMQKLGPDWYLASVCEKQFEDSLLFECLELSRNSNFSPSKLGKCHSSALSDSERMDCLRTIAENSKSREIFQPGVIPGNRKPASGKPTSKARRKALQLPY